jgi:lambda family phage portal protein
MNFAKHDRPGQTFTPFTKLVLRMVAVATDVTYELLSGDYEGINYSNLRGIRNDFQKQLKPIQDRHIRQFVKPVYQEFLDSAVLSGALYLPNYETKRLQYLEATFLSPGDESIDPLREGKATIDLIANGLESPQNWIASKGRDPEQVLNQLAEWQKLVEEKGVILTPTKTNLASAPGSITGSDMTISDVTSSEQEVEYYAD